MTKPLVSIVIPTRNRPKMLGVCLDSLTAQVEVNFRYEVIVIDDHSNTQALLDYQLVLDEHHNHFPLIFLRLPDGERGAVFARNLGIQHAQGKYVGFLDDDAVPSQEWISTLARYFETYPEIAGITGLIQAIELKHPLSVFRQNFYDQRYKRLMKPETKRALQEQYDLRGNYRFFLANSLSGGNSAVKLTILKEANSFDTDFPMMHDKELALRLLNRGYVCAFVPELTIKHAHTKSVRDAVGKSFYSGKVHYHLKRRHPNSGRVVSLMAPFQSITMLRLGGLEWKEFLFVFVIIALEYIHQIGFIVEWVVQQF